MNKSGFYIFFWMMLIQVTRAVSEDLVLFHDFNNPEYINQQFVVIQDEQINIYQSNCYSLEDAAQTQRCYVHLESGQFDPARPLSVIYYLQDQNGQKHLSDYQRYTPEQLNLITLDGAATEQMLKELGQRLQEAMAETVQLLNQYYEERSQAFEKNDHAERLDAAYRLQDAKLHLTTLGEVKELYQKLSRIAASSEEFPGQLLDFYLKVNNDHLSSLQEKLHETFNQNELYASESQLDRLYNELDRLRSERLELEARLGEEIILP